MQKILLKNLLEGVGPIPDDLNQIITGIELDSRKIKPDNVFVALQGEKFDGRKFIYDACKQGAKVILQEATEQFAILKTQDYLSIFIPNLREQVAKIAANFFQDPCKQLKIIGVTGTNGKTSVAHFIGGVLQQLNIKCGILGTLGNGLYGHLAASNLTTPDAINIQQLCTDFVGRNAHYVAMEVSSHSILQGRVNAIPFEVAIFTNLTRDHLDYHGTMVAYGEIKKKLFTSQNSKQAIINFNDPFGLELISILYPQKQVIGYGLGELPPNLPVPMVYAPAWQLSKNGIKAQIISPWGSGEIFLPLMGEFNLTNVLAVLSALCAIGFSYQKVLQSLNQLRGVPGRMQKIGGNGKPLVVIDYAHTPDALEKALTSLQLHIKGKLYCVFGCGGDRDKGKRALMAEIAEKYADQVIVTSDNPRHEDAIQIMREIRIGFAKPDKVLMQVDRALAIHFAIQAAKNDDCILIAGKGAENYQQIGDTKLPFSDIEQADKFLT